jgi:hypothetical protein
MKMIKSNGTFNSKIAISQKPLQITITIAVIRGITVRRMLDGSRLNLDIFGATRSALGGG